MHQVQLAILVQRIAIQLGDLRVELLCVTNADERERERQSVAWSVEPMRGHGSSRL